MWLVLTALLHATPPETTCFFLDARILKRRRFLSIRMAEHSLHPYGLSPYCEAHAGDEDCQLLPSFQDQRDVSRDVAELSLRPDGGAPESDPVLLPLLRRRRELQCAGAPPEPSRDDVK